jgi:hypothetical protein
METLRHACGVVGIYAVGARFIAPKTLENRFIAPSTLENQFNASNTVGARFIAPSPRCRKHRCAIELHIGFIQGGSLCVSVFQVRSSLS